MTKYLKLLRLNHWAKNLLIFLPLIFNKDLFHRNLLIKTASGWFLFGILSSMIYIFNDIKDIEKDRQHPRKCRRPLPAGEITIRNAWLIFSRLF